MAGRAPQGCGGFERQAAEGSFSYQAPYSGEYVVFVDNGHSMFSSKDVALEVWGHVRLPDETRQDFADALDGGAAELSDLFVYEPFDLMIASCGQANAFSATDTGNITICSELIASPSRPVSPGALTGIYMHEVGHTLLNQWGLPNYRNEQTVDEFAAVMMMLAEERDQLEEYLAFFAGRNAVQEARGAQMGHSPHPLSVQRMRNIGHVIDNADDYVARWLPVLIPHMTDEALAAALEEDRMAELAKEEIADREANRTTEAAVEGEADQLAAF